MKHLFCLACATALAACAAPIPSGPRIGALQGRAHVSPLNGQHVQNVRGIVTAKRSNGFYIQDIAPDGDPATSDAIFVNTDRFVRPKSGDLLVISGTVSELRAPGNPAFLSVTVLGEPGLELEILERDRPLPAPLLLGKKGRPLPVKTYEDDAPGGDVEAGGVFDPDSDGLDYWESLEGMLVQVDDAVVSGPTRRFSSGSPSAEVYVLADRGESTGGTSTRNSRGALTVQPDDFNPERIIITNIFIDVPTLDVGDVFVTPITGVVDYTFGKYGVNAIRAYKAERRFLPREQTATPATDQLAVACFNVENLDPNDAPQKFQRLADIIVKNLQSPDLLSLQEIQDNNGATIDTLTDASKTYETLIGAIRVAGGPSYSWRDVAPTAGQDGGEPGGNIRVGFLFRSDRGLSFVDRPGASANKANEVLRSPAGRPELVYSPGRIEPGNPAFRNSRKPLAGEFLWKGKPLFVIANHFNSKGGDEPLHGRYQPPRLGSEASRIEQAAAVNRFVQELLRVDRNANVIVLGDLNDFEFSKPLDALQANGALSTLALTLPPGERYSYVYEGNAQVLDQILISKNLLETAAPQYDVVHVNSEYAERASDHEPSLVRLRLP